MKRFPLIPALLWALCAGAPTARAADVLVAPTDFQLVVVTNRRVTLTPAGALGNGTNLVVVEPRSLVVSNAAVVFSNTVAGTYRLDISGAPPTALRLQVPAGSGLLNAVDLLVTATNAVTGAAGYAYSAAASDARYVPLALPRLTNWVLQGNGPAAGVTLLENDEDTVTARGQWTYTGTVTIPELWANAAFLPSGVGLAWDPAADTEIFGTAAGFTLVTRGGLAAHLSDTNAEFTGPLLGNAAGLTNFTLANLPSVVVTNAKAGVTLSGLVTSNGSVAVVLKTNAPGTQFLVGTNATLGTPWGVCSNGLWGFGGAQPLAGYSVNANGNLYASTLVGAGTTFAIGPNLMYQQNASASGLEFRSYNGAAWQSNFLINTNSQTTLAGPLLMSNYTATAYPALTGGTSNIFLWNSNKVLYLVSQTKTNLISDGR